MSHFISKLHPYRRQFVPRNDSTDFQAYLALKLTEQVQDGETPASTVDVQK
jgi:hypothetical protein